MSELNFVMTFLAVLGAVVVVILSVFIIQSSFEKIVDRRIYLAVKENSLEKEFKHDNRFS